MTSPLVSVITPTHNGETLVGETIESVIAQSFIDWEMVIVDDHSQDGTFDLLKSFQAKDSRIRPIAQRQGIRGPAATRNYAIENARGRYIAFLDSDDLWHPDKLARQIAFMASENEVFCYTWYFKIDQSSQVIGVFNDIPERLTYKNLLRTCPIGCLTVVYDTAHFGKAYMPDIAKGQDYGLWLQLLKRCPAARLLPETLAFYRVGRSTSLSSNKFKKAGSIWRLYRKFEGMNLPQAAFHLIRHSVNAVRKY